MCFDGCGNTIQRLLKACMDECIELKMIPKDAKLMVDAEPNGLGLHQLTVTITSSKENFTLSQSEHNKLTAKIKEAIIFDVIDEQEEQQQKHHPDKNWINMLLNTCSMGLVLALTALLTPSILLTISLTTLTFVSTAFTSREYLVAFVKNFGNKSFANMATTISLGWFLSMAHTLFHAISMPLASSSSMIFMNFIMPTMLIACINGMDELKRLIMEKSKKIQLKGIKTLFPQMANTYNCHKITATQSAWLAQIITPLQDTTNLTNPMPVPDQEQQKCLQAMLEASELKEEPRMLLSKGMVLDINTLGCFPVDCIVIAGNTLIDASLLTGEPHQNKKLWQFIPAGAVNLGPKVTVYSVKNPYNSTVNALLFRANRAKHAALSKEEIPRFAYFYSGLVLIGLLGAIVTPLALGIATIPLVLQNIIGILFSLCPCTIAIAHQLPQLISLHQRSHKKIQLRDEGLVSAHSTEIHTVVFDKTGTLTTGKSIVESSTIPNNSTLWQRIYLLEKAHGKGHPLARAIEHHYETVIKNYSLFDDVSECVHDAKNRGLSAKVQGKKIHIGNEEYLRDNGILLPPLQPLKMTQGCSAICIAENGIYKGVIYVRHEIRRGIVAALTRLKNEGKKIIMLTGDTLVSAQGLNRQMGSVFAEEAIYASQTPADKEACLSKLLNQKNIDPRGVWFVGDGLNDAPCCRVVSEKGGISCAMDSSDKSAFFTDITLNSSLDYLFAHHKLNQTLQLNIKQNKGIILYSIIAFVTFIMSFSVAGIAVSPLIPMAIMLATTLFVLFNAYRAQLSVDITMDKKSPWYKKLLGSNASMGLLLSASIFLTSSVLVATIALGTLTLPILTFTSGIALAFSSVCSLLAISLLGIFTGVLSATLLLSDNKHKTEGILKTSTAHAIEPYHRQSCGTEEIKNTVELFGKRKYETKGPVEACTQEGSVAIRSCLK